jgi:hypothetical protein
MRAVENQEPIKGTCMTADYSMRSSILDAQTPLMNFSGESISGCHCQQVNIIGVGYLGPNPCTADHRIGPCGVGYLGPGPCFDSCLFL